MDSTLPPSSIDDPAGELRRRWASGKRIPLDAILRERPGVPGNEAQMLALIATEASLRQEAGQTVSAEDYLRRFPHLAVAIERLFAQQATCVERAARVEVDTLSVPGATAAPPADEI